MSLVQLTVSLLLLRSHIVRLKTSVKFNQRVNFFIHGASIFLNNGGSELDELDVEQSAVHRKEIAEKNQIECSL
jgi:hypothetical protein